MARFEPGHKKVPGSGRKKGQQNRATLFRIEAFFLEKGIEPLEELLKLMPVLRSDIQAKVWLDVISYYNVKPRPDDGPGASQGIDMAKLIALLPPELQGPLLKILSASAAQE